MARTPRRWIRKVAETSNAMDLPPGIFTRSPRAIAEGLKASVTRSRRTKGTKFQSAMSMLNLYINRSGRQLSRDARKRLEAAKPALRALFGKNEPPQPGGSGTRRRRMARRRTAAQRRRASTR